MSDETPERIDVAWVRAQVARLAEAAGPEPAEADGEGLHSWEDELYRDVLAAIAEGRCEDPAACAAAALTSQAIRFDRWYA